MYDGLSKWYPLFFVNRKIQVDFIQKYLPESGTVGDLACGPGMRVEQLNSLGHKAFGFDLSTSMSRIKGSFSKANLAALPLKKESFDVLVCFGNGTSHLNKKEREEFYKKCYQALKPNGYLLLQWVNWTVGERAGFEFPVLKKENWVLDRDYRKCGNQIEFKTKVSYLKNVFYQDTTWLHPHDLDELLPSSRWRVEGHFENFNQKQFVQNKSPGQIVVLQKK